jgi:hypothetical protein
MRPLGAKERLFIKRGRVRNLIGLSGWALRDDGYDQTAVGRGRSMRTAFLMAGDAEEQHPIDEPLTYISHEDDPDGLTLDEAFDRAEMEHI